MDVKKIDYDVCTGCLECVKACANSRVIERNDRGLPEFKNDYKCIFCGHCLAICPQQAISFEPVDRPDQPEKRYRVGAYPLKNPLREMDGEALLEFFASTRSERFYSERPVEKERIRKVLDAMVRAPSAGNEQNRNYYIYDDPAQIHVLEERVKAYYQKLWAAYRNPFMLHMMSFLMAGNMKKALGPQATFSQGRAFAKKLLTQKTPLDFSYLRSAPVLFVITSDPKKGMHQSFYKADTAIAVTYGILAARALGLSACWMGLLEIALKKNAQLRDPLKLKKDEIVTGAFILGYSDTEWKNAPPRGPVKVVWNGGD